MKTKNERHLGARILTAAMSLALILSAALPALPGGNGPTASADTLPTKLVYMFLDPNTQAMLDARIAGSTWTPPAQLLQVGDELGIIIKVVPKDGTTTGAGGHVDFYVPNGTTVIDAATLLPGDSNPGDGISGYDKAPMKGQALIATGAGPIGAKATTQLVGLGTVGPNVLGFSADPVATGTGLHRGTIAGVYGDTGIFYATDPDTSYGSWQRFTGDEELVCGMASLPGVTGQTITNNSGDVFVPCNKWDAGQLFAWGVKGTTCTDAGCQDTPIVDSGDGRGNAPWGFASGVAGPQSGYAWAFNWNKWAASPQTAADLRDAMGNDAVGSWKRIRYPGSRIASDQPGSTSTALGIASVDGSSVGRIVSPSNPLPATTSQSDDASPKAIRWAVGQLTSLTPEFVWVKIRVDDMTAIVNDDGCPVFNGDAFGGDAGGSDNGKDHLWRYYKPSPVTWNGCLALGKPATKDVVKIGDIYQYKIKVYNAGTIDDFTGVEVKDTLPAGVQLISAFPAPASGLNPLVWTVPSLMRGESWEATVAVKATGAGVLENMLCVDAPGMNADQCVIDETSSGSIPMLKQGKSASVTTVAPGGTVQYTLRIDNIGSGPTGNPITVQEYLPAGFTFLSKDLATLNGANVTVATTVNTSAPYSANRPFFTVPGVLLAGQSLVIKFTANVPSGTAVGTYCNSYTSTQNGIPLTTGSLACITVGAGAIGDTVFRDWNGNGVQDIGDEGIAGVTFELRNSSNAVIANTTTGINGVYSFEGLAAGVYTVKITDVGGLLAGYTQTLDPNAVCPGAGCDGQSTVTLVAGQRNMDQDFGYKPSGAGQVGDTVWKDDGSGGGAAGDGIKNGAEPGIANVIVTLVEDTNGNSAIDPDDAPLATTQTNASGIYGFTGLALELDYLVKIDEADPDFLSVFSGPNPIAASTFRLQQAQPTADTLTIDTLDFGYYEPPPAAMGDTVCQDTDGDRLCTGADAPLPNVDVQLYRDLNRNALVDPGEPLLATDVTDANGLYGFDSLAAGAYVLQVNLADPDLPGGLASVRNPQGVSLAPGQSNVEVDFPFVSRLTKSVRNVTTGQNPGANAGPGETLEFKILPNYTGSSLLSSLKVTDTIPTGTTFVSAAPAPTTGPDPLVWNLGSNTAGAPGLNVYCPIETTLVAAGDTTISSDSPGNNFGADNTINLDSNRIRHGLVRFDLPSIPPNSVLQGAKLKVTVEGGQNANRTADVRALTRAWTEGTQNNAACTTGATWNAPNCTDTGTGWNGSGGDFGIATPYGASLGTISPAVDEATYSVDVFNTVQGWFTTPSSNRGFVLLATGSDTGEVKFHARTSTAGKEPRLTLEFLTLQSGACTINTHGQAIFSVNANAPKYTLFDGATNAWGTAANAATFANNQRYLALASGTTRNESIAVSVLDNNTVAGQVWNGTSWSVIPGPPAGASGQLGTVSADTFYSADVAYESASGDAVVVWDDNSQSAGNKLRFATATYDGTTTTWSGAASIAAYTGDEPLAMHLVSKSGTDGMVLAVNDLAFDDYALVWDGSAWGNGLSLDASGTAVDDRTSLDAAYETQSGEAMVVYAKNNDAKVYYRLWNGAAWSAEAPLSAPPGVSSQPQWLVLGADPSSDRIALGVLTTNKTVWLSVWNGSAWGATTTATAGAQTKDSPVMSVAFESLTGRALAVYGEGKNVRYRLWTSGANAWTAEINGFALADNTATLVLDRDPNSNEIMLTGLDSKKRVVARLWNGSAWGATTTLSSDSNYNKGQPFDFDWRQDVLSRTSTKAALTTNRTFVADTGGGLAIQVLLTVESSKAGTVTANALTVNTTGGAGATCSGPDPSGAQAIAANGRLSFTYACTVTAGATPGSVTFTTTPTGAGTDSIVQATSNSVLATPPLTFRATVNNPATASEVDNVAAIGDGSGNLSPTNSNQTKTTIPSGAIGGAVWYDLNGNGLQDFGEPPVTEGAGLDLYRDANGNGRVDLGEAFLAVKSTNPSGLYSFPNLPPGNYVVAVEAQQAPAPPGSPSAGQIRRMVISTGSEIGRTVTCTGATCSTITDAGFGFIEAAAVEGAVFHDVNHDGAQNGTEPGLPNVTVTLTGTDLSGNSVTRTQSSDGNGKTRFIVPPGSYTMSYDTADPDIPSGLTEATTPASLLLTAQAGVESTGYDFGRDHRGRIGDRIWNDANGNGSQNAGEPGLANVTVTVCSGTPCNSGNAIAIAATNSTGFYQFAGLPDGTTYVGVNTATVPAGYTQTGYGDPGASCGGACANQSPAIPILGGNGVLTVDFGYRPPTTGVYSVSGTIWDDQDNNGLLNIGEPGIPGVMVCLTDLAGTTVVACTTTQANGDYMFPGISNGAYLIKVDPTTLPSTAYYQTGDPDGVKDNQTTATVNNAPVVGNNFGYGQVTGEIKGTLCLGTGDGLCSDDDASLSDGVPVFLTYAGRDGIVDTADDVARVAATDGNGDFSFTDQPPGNYQITKANPPDTASFVDADGDNPNNISVALDFGPDGIPGNGDDRLVKTDQDFEVKPGAGFVGKRVWLDVDGDGVPDNGEPGLANVAVALVIDDDGTPGPSAGDAIFGATVTDANGAYLFGDVPAGVYYVDVDDATTPAGLDASPGATDPSAVFTLSSPGESYLDANFGYTATPANAVIGDLVWADSDGDGVQNPGEVGIGGANVTLLADNDGDGNFTDVVDVTTTGPDGTYLFTNVAPGKVVVQVDDGAGTPLVAYTPTAGPESEGSDTSRVIFAAAGDVVPTVDFGYDTPDLATISDRVWYDADRDGLPDSGESGIGDVTVNLLDSSDATIATVFTHPDGVFTFGGVPNGSYVIAIADNTGTLGGFQPTTRSASASEKPVVVSGSDVTGAAFGYTGSNFIGDIVWSDANSNGIRDPGEPGILEVEVRLYFDDGDGLFEPDGDDVLIVTRATAIAGDYLFTDLPKGGFWVSVDNTQPSLADYRATTRDGDPATPTSTEILATLTPTLSSYLKADFGYQNPALADVSGAVWNDTNVDAFRNSAEPGIAGVTMALVNSDGHVLAMTPTDPDGNYAFSGVAPGSYPLAATDRDGILDGYTLTSGLDKIPVDVAATDIVDIIDVVFGYVRNPATGAIGDTVWHDANRDGAQNGAEPGIPNVQLKLYRDSDGYPGPSGGDALMDTQVSGIYGQVLFTGLLAGAYYVEVVDATLPGGMAPTAGTTDPSALIALSAGEFYPDAGFGYASQASAASGGRVWHDVDGDGMQDPGEPGIGGVTMTVSGPSCLSGCLAVADAAGSWLRSGLAPGAYTAVVTPPGGYNATPTNGPAARSIVMPATGEDVLYANFGFAGGPSNGLGDTIYLDFSGNGGQDAGEPSVAGVTLSLLDNSGQVIATSVTGANGVYSFTGLPGGSYTVVVTDVDTILGGVRQTQDPDQMGVCTTCDGRGTRTVSGGIADSSVDFGYAPVGGAIGNQVWHDKDGDGLYEPKGNDTIAGNADDESGMEGILISLYLDVNGNDAYDPGIDNRVRTTATDVNGQYLFAGLPAGSYLVDVASANFAAGGVLEGFDKTVGATPGANNSSQADPYLVILTSGAGGVASGNDTADFGYDAPIPYSIAGTVFDDVSRDGVYQQGAESPIAGATVTLVRDPGGNGVIDPADAVIGSMISANNGDYLFTDLPPGKFIVSVNALATNANGTFQSTQTTTPQKGVQPATIVSANVVDRDFGFYQFRGTPLAINLASFTAVVQDGAVALAWETVSEIDLLGFDVYRATAEDGPWTKLNDGVMPAQNPGAARGAEYQLTDPDLAVGQYWYRLDWVDAGGAQEAATTQVEVGSLMRKMWLPMVVK